jgi:hypothetical protein
VSRSGPSAASTVVGYWRTARQVPALARADGLSRNCPSEDGDVLRGAARVTPPDSVVDTQADPEEAQPATKPVDLAGAAGRPHRRGAGGASGAAISGSTGHDLDFLSWLVLGRGESTCSVCRLWTGRLKAAVWAVLAGCGLDPLAPSNEGRNNVCHGSPILPLHAAPGCGRGSAMR